LRFILQSKQGKLRFLLLHIEETAFYQLLEPLYQVQNLSNLKKKTKGKKSLPTKKLVTKKQSPPQPRINPAFRQKVRKTYYIAKLDEKITRRMAIPQILRTRISDTLTL
jgi:hypothetical protein